MSSLTPTPNALPQLESKPQPAADAQKLRDQLKALLDQPDLLPDKFLSYMTDYLAVNQPLVPISQILGFTDFTANQATTSGTVTTTSTTYVALSGGPTLSGLSDGNYLLLFGSQSSVSSAGQTALASPSVNGATPSDAVAAVSTDSTNEGSRVSAAIVALSAGANSVELKYRSNLGTSTAKFLGRWLIAIRFSNL
ncbi:MAG TPA: hypothetical protein VIV12_31650 [Streptosporangiaceae bacterium]